MYKVQITLNNGFTFDRETGSHIYAFKIYESIKLNDTVLQKKVINPEGSTVLLKN